MNFYFRQCRPNLNKRHCNGPSAYFRPADPLYDSFIEPLFLAFKDQFPENAEPEDFIDWIRSQMELRQEMYDRAPSLPRASHRRSSIDDCTPLFPGARQFAHAVNRSFAMKTDRTSG